MSKVSANKKNRRKAFAFKKLTQCWHCKEWITTGHFVPPCLGDAGFWVCEAAICSVCGKTQSHREHDFKSEDCNHAFTTEIREPKE